MMNSTTLTSASTSACFARLRARLRSECGVTMLLALFILTITTALLGTAYIAVLGDTGLAANDLSQKQAYAAAQAGIQAYNYDLNENPNYWETCTSIATTTVPGSSGSNLATYHVNPMVASTIPTSYTTCSTSDPIDTMIEANTLTGGGTNPAAGTFRIASTGTADGVSRTIVAQYKRSSFVNFVYYTDYETLDPAAIGNPSDCARHYGASPARGSDCGGAISFVTADNIQGPLHSEDSLAICGNPTFGRTSADQIQTPGFVAQCGGSGPLYGATMNGTLNTSAPSLTSPPTDAQLLAETQSAYQFVGATTIVLNAGNMTVTNASYNGGVAKTIPDPSNGVVYVSSSPTIACGETYSPFSASNLYVGGSSYNAACGNAYVSTSGSGYTSSLTIATDNDIIINGSILTPVNGSGVPTGTALLGLIANNFVRIYHPISGTNTGTPSNISCSATNAAGYLSSPTIYAAILAVNHSFILDNYNCGSPMGTLKVYGAIAQMFRGTVGAENSGTITSGYAKSYIYDDRLASVEPPYFLNPVTTAWYVQRQTECAASSSSC